MKLPGPLLSPNSKNKKPRSQGISYTFSKSFTYISGNRTFLSFLKNTTDLRELFFFSDVFYVILLPTFAPQVLRIWENFFYPETFFNLHYFPTFGTTCFHQVFPGSQRFFHEGCRASHWGSKHRPSPCLCLNHIVFSKK